ncbi:MAG: hypothetical protein J0I07_12100 [Myxococcales bacterium]|nr:hypothetical protein [Myxococcales bacterium]
MTRSAMLALAAVLCFSCSKKDKEEAPAGSSTSAGATGATAPAAPAGSPPPDGKYERVIVDGVTVPMINVMDNGATILVDTDGVKPRTWEEQYKRKRSSLLVGQYDLHKTNANKNDTFEDDPIDKEGLWVIDSKGNITRH